MFPALPSAHASRSAECSMAAKWNATSAAPANPTHQSRSARTKTSCAEPCQVVRCPTSDRSRPTHSREPCRHRRWPSRPPGDDRQTKIQGADAAESARSAPSPPARAAVCAASPLLTNSTLPALSVILARATLGASPIMRNEGKTRSGRPCRYASSACSATEVDWWASRSSARRRISRPSTLTRTAANSATESASRIISQRISCHRTVRGHHRIN